MQVATIQKASGTQNTYSTLTSGQGAMQVAKQNADDAKFSCLVSSIEEKTDTKEKTQKDTELEKSKACLPQGAANRGKYIKQGKTIDKSSILYQKSLELEGFFVKQMLSSMRSSLSKQGLNGKDSYAKTMYEDMLYDEYATKMTQLAGFGLADQIYLSLV